MDGGPLCRRMSPSTMVIGETVDERLDVVHLLVARSRPRVGLLVRCNVRLVSSRLKFNHVARHQPQCLLFATGG